MPGGSTSRVADEGVGARPTAAAAQAAAQAAARSQLAAALQLATTAREDSARLRAELVPL